MYSIPRVPEISIMSKYKRTPVKTNKPKDTIKFNINLAFFASDIIMMKGYTDRTISNFIATFTHIHMH